MSLVIKFIAVADAATGVIESVSMAPGAHLPEQGLIPGTSPAKELIWVPSEGWEGIDNLKIHEEYFRKDQQWVHRGPRPTRSHTWNTDENAWVLDSEDFWATVRQERDRRLTVSDWTQVIDNNLEESVKASWRAYRTVLRNIPELHPDVTALDQIPWPDPPDGSTVEVTVW
tara:strand:- start:455 stop:967 length:513 start_codon:yes stop_codon:yes gene_type:complete